MEFSAAKFLEDSTFQLLTDSKCVGKVPNSNVSISIEIERMGELSVKSFFDEGVLESHKIDIYEMQLSPRLVSSDLDNPNNWVVRTSSYSPKAIGNNVQDHIFMSMQVGFAVQSVAAIMQELHGRLPEVMAMVKNALEDLDAEIAQERSAFESKHQKLTKDMIENIVLPMLKSDAREKGESELTVHTSQSTKVTFKCLKKSRSLQFFRGKIRFTEAELIESLQNTYLEKK